MNLPRPFGIKPPKTCSNPLSDLAMGKTAATKPAAAPKKGVKKDPKEKNPEAETMDKKDVSNMLGTLKCSKDPEKKELLEFYKSLPRFDSQKNELLKKWKADKSCKWFGSYKESRTQEHSTTHNEFSGFATKFLVLNCFLSFLKYMSHNVF